MKYAVSLKTSHEESTEFVDLWRDTDFAQLHLK